MGPSTHSLPSGSGEKPGVGICTCLVTAHYISQGELDSDKTSGTNIHAMACFTSKGIVGCWGQIHCHQGREKGPGDRLHQLCVLVLDTQGVLYKRLQEFSVILIQKYIIY